MSGVSKVYQSVSNAMCRKRSNHKGLRAFRPGFDSPRIHLESLGNKAFFVLKEVVCNETAEALYGKPKI